MPDNVPPFTISGHYRGIVQAETRSSAASAMCLADDWAEFDWQDIKITDGAGVVRTPDEFRANLRLVKRLKRPR